MTTAVNDRLSGPHAGNGVSNLWPYDFYVASSGELRVTRRSAAGVDTLLTYGVDFTATGIGNPAGGTIALTTVLAAGEKLFCEGVTALSQGLALDGVDSFKTVNVEGAHDRAMRIDQELQRDLSRAVRVVIGENGLTLPSSEERAGKYSAYDSEGKFVALEGTDAGLPIVSEKLAAAQVAQAAAEAASGAAEAAEILATASAEEARRTVAVNRQYSGAKIALIFDDGYRNNRTVAAPVLARYGYAATLALEIDRVNTDYGGDPLLPVCTATDLRELIADYGWEICNHPQLNIAETEANMAAAAIVENTLLVDILTGAKVWNGAAMVAATPTHTQYATYKVRGAVYRGGSRNANSDAAFETVFDKVRTINGPIATYGDRLHTTDQEGPLPMHWTAFTADTNGSDNTLQTLISWVRSFANTGMRGVIYAHSVPPGSGSATVPYISENDLDAVCRAAYEAGVQIVPWSALGRSNLLHDPRFESANSHTLTAASGDSAAYSASDTLNGAPRCAVLTATAYRTNLANTSWQSDQFSVEPFTRYRVKIRYKIGTALTLSGGIGNVNHGLAAAFNTIEGNTAGNSNGSMDDYELGRNTPGYARKYDVTSGYASWEMEFYSGYGFSAVLTLGLFQCTGTVRIGHVIIEKGESIARMPLRGTHTYDTVLGRDIYLLTPSGLSASRKWEWEFRVDADAVITIGETVDYAYQVDTDIAAPTNGQTCYVLFPASGAFAGQDGKKATYNSGSGTWSFAAIATRTLVKANVGEGFANQYYMHLKASGKFAQFERLSGRAWSDQVIIDREAEGRFSVYNKSGLRSDTFRWSARPRWIGG